MFFTYTLQRFSCLQDIFNNTAMKVTMMVTLGIFSYIQLMFVSLNVRVSYNMIAYGSKKCWKFILGQILLTLLLNIGQPALCWVFVTVDMGTSERPVCAILLFISGGLSRPLPNCFSSSPGIHSMYLLSRLPKIGVQTVMMFKVAMSVFSFFTAFFALFLSFCLIFHILLHNTKAFGSLEDAFIKVIFLLLFIPFVVQSRFLQCSWESLTSRVISSE